LQELSLLLSSWNMHSRSFVVLVSISRVIEESVKLIVLFGRDGIVLMVVTLRAPKRRSHPDRHGGIHTIDDRFMTKLFVIGSPFGISHRISMKAGRDFLFARSIGQQIARNLPNGKPVERNIPVQRGDDPIPIWPDRPATILFVALRISVPRQVQP